LQHLAKLPHSQPLSTTNHHSPLLSTIISHSQPTTYQPSFATINIYSNHEFMGPWVFFQAVQRPQLLGLSGFTLRSVSGTSQRERSTWL